jgi:glycosyltransferase involved in cell wall biosynthesis
MRKCVISSPVATQSGYGHHAREVIDNIIEQRGNHWDIKLLSMPWGSTPLTFPLPDHMRTRLVPLPLKEQPDIWIQITIPNEFQPVGKFNIGITAVTEGDICSKEWIEAINRMQVIVVPSNFTKSVLTKTAEKHNIAITPEIHVISEYFNKDVYSKDNKQESIDLSVIHEQFCYLFVGHWLQGSLGEDRKNISGLIHNFIETFKNKDKAPGLILKTSSATYSVTDREKMEKYINEIRDLFPKTAKLPNIYLLHGDLSDNEMNSLYNHSKVKAMVSYTKGEGFGRPLLEFASTGKPIIAPHYSGQADFLKKEYIVALAGGLTEVHPSARNQWIIEGSKWFTPDYAYSKKAMREVHKHYNKFIPGAREQKKFVLKNFVKDAIAPSYTKLIDLIESRVVEGPSMQQLKLPKLNKPNLKTVDLPKLKLPKLQKA